jgi:AcrR family transcriptional regulator
MAKRGPERSNAERRASTRRALLDAASAVVAERGYHDASVALIAERAGCSTGAVYAHFGSKEQLFTTLVDEHLNRQMLRYGQADVEGGDIGGEAEEAAGAWIDYLVGSPEYFSVFISFWDYATRVPELRDHLRDRFVEMRRLVCTLIERGAAASGVPLDEGDAERAAILIMALGNGIALERMVDPGAVPDDYFGSMVGEVLGALASKVVADADGAPTTGETR